MGYKISRLWVDKRVTGSEYGVRSQNITLRNESSSPSICIASISGHITSLLLPSQSQRKKTQNGFYSPEPLSSLNLRHYPILSTSNI